MVGSINMVILIYFIRIIQMYNVHMRVKSTHHRDHTEGTYNIRILLVTTN